MNGKMRIAVVDDVAPICEDLIKMLIKNEALVGGMKIAAFRTATQLYNILKEGEQYDLIFLDIVFKGSKDDGFGVGHKIRFELRDEMTIIVYISSIPSYDFKNDKMNSTSYLDYLIKPISEKDVVQVLKRALIHLKKNESVFIYDYNKSEYKIPSQNIMYFALDNRVVRIITIGTGDNRVCYKKIDEIWDMTKSMGFIRIHHSFIVNPKHIARINTNDLLMNDGTLLRISKAWKAEAHDKISESSLGGI